MQGSVRTLKAAPKLHNYNSTRNINSDTQKYTHIKNIHTHPKLTELNALRMTLKFLLED